MKKHLLLLCLSLLCMSGIASAESSTSFGYATEAATQLSLGGVTAGKSRIYLAYELRGEDAALFVGNSITAVTVRSGRGKLHTNTGEVEIFITKKLGEEPLVKQSATLETRANRDNVVTLNTPFEIKDDTPLYIGYSFPAPDAGTYIPIDDIPSADSNFYFATSDDDSLPAGWYTAGSDRGSLYCPVTITGNNIPGRLAYVVRTKAPGIAVSGTSGNCEVTVINRGTESITSIEFETKVGDGEPVTTVVDRGVYMRPGVWKTFSTTVPFVGEGSLDVVPTITKVNGEEVPHRSGLGSIVVYEQGYDRNLVIEEATGTWCGYCPAGIVMLDYVRKTYGDRFFCIAYHGGSNTEPMADATCNTFISAYASGFPYTITNRVDAQTPSGLTVEGQRSFVDKVYTETTATPIYCKLDIDAVADGKTLNVKATSQFAINVKGNHALSFVLVEDNVGPYIQENYYAQLGRPMEGWEKKFSEVSYVFDDVARHLEGSPTTGISGSLPDELVKGERYTYECTLPLNKVKGDKYRVIGMIINKTSGEIVNAAYWDPQKPAGVLDVDVEEADAPVEYFNLQGIRVDNPEGGVYIRKQGKQTSKVYVK